MKKLLLVDADPLSRCVLDVGLRKLGYVVTTAEDGDDALAKADEGAFDLVLTDTRLPGLDGLALVRKLKEKPATVDTPIMFLASVESIEDRKRALELGVGDYLAKPVYLGELAGRIQMLLARRTREKVVSKAGRTRFNGSTRELALVDLIHNFELSRKSGVVHLYSETQDAYIYFRYGRVVDAELGAVRGEEAVYRALIWGDAGFDVEFKPIDHEDVIACSTPELVVKGMRRVDEWVRLCEQVRPLAALLDVSAPQLLDRMSRLGELPEGLHAMLRLPATDPLPALPPALAHARASNAPQSGASHASTIAPPPSGASPASVATFAQTQSEPPQPSTVASSQSDAPHPPAPSSPPSAPPPASASLPLPTTAVASSPAPRREPTASVSRARVAASSSDDVDRSDPPPPTAAAMAEPTAPAAPSRVPSQRPSAAPWTREIGASQRPPADADDVAAGVPRAMAPSAKRVVIGLTAVAAALVIAFGLRSVRARQAQEAEAARGPEDVAAASSAQAMPPPASSAWAAAHAPPPEEAQVPPAASSASTNAEAPASSAAPQSAAVAAPVEGADLPASGHAPGESAIDMPWALTSKSALVRDSERALLKGQLDRALSLAQQAVGDTPTEADAWLTLAAARKASGDLPGAREAYTNCIAQAQTASAVDCRILARALETQ